MKVDIVKSLSVVLTLAASLAMIPHSMQAAKPSLRNAETETVELFSAEKDGLIDVRFIPMNSERGTIIITNHTDKKLNIDMPAAFAGIPVLAQNFGGGGGGQGGFGGQQGGQGGQGGGQGGFGGGQGGGGGGGGGFFNVMPGKVQRVKVQGVCLDHGLEDPNPKIEYRIRPSDEYTTKPGVADLLHMLGSKKLSQKAAQAGAWHLNNDMSWRELAAKSIHHLDGSVTMYFSRQEISVAMQASEAAVKIHNAREKYRKTLKSQASLAD
ncbi:MAG: hypothetical protein COA78_10125 [Blastopirellula sp.]|nr:MAG: hypothetical protein COA78_10125 [Blastopirellula sp.]